MRGNPYSYQSIAYGDPGYDEEPEDENGEVFVGLIWGEGSPLDPNGVSGIYHLGNDRYLKFRITREGITLNPTSNGQDFGDVKMTAQEWYDFINERGFG